MTRKFFINRTLTLQITLRFTHIFVSQIKLVFWTTCQCCHPQIEVVNRTLSTLLTTLGLQNLLPLKAKETIIDWIFYILIVARCDFLLNRGTCHEISNYNFVCNEGFDVSIWVEIVLKLCFCGEIKKNCFKDIWYYTIVPMEKLFVALEIMY